MTNHYVYRPATIADTEIIADQRYLMFAEMGMDTDMLAKSRKYYVPWLAERLSNGIYQGILVEHEHNIIAGAGMWLGMGAPLPNVHTSDLRRGNIVNVYTEPAHRRQGIARELMNRLIKMAQQLGYPVLQLHASDAGKSIYEAIGFSGTQELRRVL